MNTDNEYLYEIIENYKDSGSEEEKDAIFSAFCSSIWSSGNKRRTYDKAIRFNVRKDLLNTDVGQVFNTWSDVSYKGYKAMTDETDWCSLIRQKINNLYTRYCDKDVILRHDYMRLLGSPKRLYYQWIDGAEFHSDVLSETIDGIMDDAENLKKTYQKQKMELSWNDYVEVVNGFLRRCFDNCKLAEDYEGSKKYFRIYDFMNEDNFYIKYFCDRLDGNMKDYQKHYNGLPYSSRNSYKRCQQCGRLIEKTNNRVMYCKECKKDKQREWDLKYKHKARKSSVV